MSDRTKNVLIIVVVACLALVVVNLWIGIGPDQQKSTLPRSTQNRGRQPVEHMPTVPKQRQSALTMLPSGAVIADYLEERMPDKDGEIRLGFTSKQRDQIVAALRLHEAVQPFIAFAKSGSFKLFGDGFVLTNGSQTQRQLTAGDFRALLAAAGEKEA